MIGVGSNKEFICAVDVGKKQDPSTIQIYRISPTVRRMPEETGRPDEIVNYLDLVYQSKFLGLRYTELVKLLLDLLKRLSMINKSQLLVDGTGIGEAVVDIMRDERLMPIPIVFTGGGSVRPVYASFGRIFQSNKSFSGGSVLKEIHVPKEDLVHAGKIIMEQGRLRIAPNVDHAEDFKKQLMGFKGKVNEKTGRRKYENETDTIHDDLVVTYLMASWWMMYRKATVEERVIQGNATADWDPHKFI